MKKNRYQGIAKFSEQDKALPHLLKFLYHFFSHNMVEALTSIIGTVAIAILCTNFNNNFVAVIIVAFIYILLTVGMALCKSYNKQRDTDFSKSMKEMLQKKDKVEYENQALSCILDNLRTLNNAAGNDIYRNARTVKHDGWFSNIKDMREVFGFQKMAISVCNEIYALLREKFRIQDPFVSVYQRFQVSKNSSVCQMIAYNLQNDAEPMSYHRQYTIPKKIKDDQKIEYHTRIFAEDSQSIRVLIDSKEVNNAFVIHKGSEEREKKISQYIGIPMNVCNRGITFLLQVDTCQQQAFGSNTQEMEAFAKLYLYQYASQLALYYEFDRFLEVTDTYVKEGRLKTNV